VRPSIATADHVTAVFGALSAMLALYWRDAQNGGRGQMIDLALFEPLFRMSEDIIPVFHRLGRVRERIGNRNPGFSPAGNFQTSDGRWIQIAAGGDRVFERLAAAMGRPELATDPRYAKARDRAANADTLETMLGEWLADLTFEDAHSLLAEANVPVGGIYAANEIFADPHYAAREDIVEVPDDRIGPVKVPAAIPKLQATPGRVVSGGPDLGSHNQEIYGGLLGVSADLIADLSARGVV
jgi:crotonobetainyl-CoA:carnitine CoA-transferase CaiB-like acyl-CoA transferase